MGDQAGLGPNELEYVPAIQPAQRNTPAAKKQAGPHPMSTCEVLIGIWVARKREPLDS